MKERMMSESNDSTQTYVFGRSVGEAQSIQQLAQILAPVTRQFLEQAGLCAGMKVLEVGSGAGDVALLAAELVGPTGTVLGVENNPAILQTARARAQAARLMQVSFVESDLTALVLSDTFDAVIGRYILHHLRDPVLVLRQLVHHLRPGGIVAFQEADLTRLGTSVPPVPLFEQVGEWIKEPFRREGLDLLFGLRLYRVFLDAGLPPPQLHCQSFLGTGPGWPWHDVMAGRVGSVLPLLLKYGLVTTEEVEISTLAQRLREAAGAGASVVMAPDLVSAWTRTLPAEGC
jgi:SAM-dependent methyltransferase